MCLCPRGVCPGCIKLNWLYLIYHPLRVTGWVRKSRGELGMVASCQQGTSLRDSERERGREREMHEAVTLMSLRIKSMAVRILNEHGLKLRSTRQAQNQIKPTRYRSLCSLLVSGDAFSASVRMGGGFLMKTDYNRIPNTCER